MEFYKKRNSSGIVTTRPITSRGEPYREPDMQQFKVSHNVQHPIIKTKEGDTVEIVGQGKLIVNGARMSLGELKNDNVQLYAKVIKLAKRMGNTAQWLGQGFDMSEYEAIVAFKKL